MTALSVESSLNHDPKLLVLKPLARGQSHPLSPEILSKWIWTRIVTCLKRNYKVLYNDPFKFSGSSSNVISLWRPDTNAMSSRQAGNELHLPRLLQGLVQVCIWALAYLSWRTPHIESHAVRGVLAQTSRIDSHFCMTLTSILSSTKKKWQ